MKIEWKDANIDVNYLLEQISNSRTVNADGSISTASFFTMDEWESVLSSYVRISGVSDSEAKILIDKAMRDHQVLTKESFKKALFEQKKKRILTAKTKFLVVFPLLGIRGDEVGKFKRNDVTLNFNPSTSSRLYRSAKRERSELLEKYPEHHRRFCNLIDSSRWCVGSVLANSPSEAYELAYRELRIILGLIVFIETPSHARVMSFGHSKPVAKVNISPQMTVHNESGKLAFNGFWHMRSFHEHKELVQFPKRGEDYRSKLEKWLSLISQSAYPEKKVENAMIRYYDAFSDHSYEDAFLAGWRVLEHVAGDRNTKYNTLVERAAVFFDEPKLAAIFGYHLAERRNALSHGHEVNQSHSESVLYQMNRLLHPILRELIINRYKFETITDFYDFCDFSWSIDRKDGLAKTVSKALEFRRKQQAD